MSKRKKPFVVKPVKIVGVTIQGPGLYTLDELREMQTRLAKQLWPTIRTDEEAELRIHEWLVRTKYLDGYSIGKLPPFAVMRYLEDEVSKHQPQPQTSTASPVTTDIDIVDTVERKFLPIWKSCKSYGDAGKRMDEKLTDADWESYKSARPGRKITKSKEAYFKKLAERWKLEGVPENLK